jgi:hypothetical protein
VLPNQVAHAIGGPLSLEEPALLAHKRRQGAEREAYHDNNLLLCHEDGTMYTRDAISWRFSKVTSEPGSATDTRTRAPHRRRS